jgi:hypothetical protein
LVNRLGSATSPYLLQHADNPVDWWPWTAEAFAEARRRDVPVLISVGYAACHWCHVMAHESFENEAIAAAMNENFVNIKVDREERPDVDAVYMTATQAMTGQGGWPMTVFATPDGEPFYCGTYFPAPAFLRVLDAIRDAWQNQRDAVTKQGAAVVEAISAPNVAGAGSLTPDLLDQAVAGLAAQFDERYAGFGGAPKFPPHLVMLFLLRHLQRTGDERSLEMVRATAEQMARGGIYDQIGGGFARYSVDDTWTVPHFEKMLYDNALLLRVYAHLWRLTGDAMARRVAVETAQFLLTDLRTPEGGFASSLDADTDGVEGLTYAWTPAQLTEAVGPEDGPWAADLFGVTEAGTFEHGTSVLRLARDIDDADEAVRTRWQTVKTLLSIKRATRPQPGRDDKVIAEWNGLAITALAEFHEIAAAMAGLTGIPVGEIAEDARTAAVEAGELLVRTHMMEGRLRRASRQGTAGEPGGVLADYGSVAQAFAVLYQVTGDADWLRRAAGLCDVAVQRFADGNGGFFDTAADAEALVMRPADPTDGATASGSSAICEALVTVTALTGETRFRSAAEAALGRVAALIDRFPRAAGMVCAVAEALLAGPVEVAIVGAGADLRSTAWRLAPPGAVIVAGAPDAVGQPLLADRPLINGAATAYVCRGFVCDRPVTEAGALAGQLARSQ